MDPDMGNVDIHGVESFVSNYKFLGLEEIPTIWGRLRAAKIQVKTTDELVWSDTLAFGKSTGTAVSISWNPINSTSTKVEYHLKNFGRYLVSGNTDTGTTTVDIKVMSTLDSSSPSYPAKSTIWEKTIVSSNFNVTPTSFSVITPTQHSSTAYLDSWTWNGSFPWVYNANTDSWFYYRFNGNACYAYDIRSSKWFAFDEGNGGWRLAQ
jgi:hypothetical protein